ncbi:MAG: hypothetical protein ABSF36_09130 [Candidatus Methanomethylicaceae archaeon]|jgi:hypothetical protein
MAKKWKVEKEPEPPVQDEGEKGVPAEESNHEDEDIYSEKQRDEMLEDDEISGAESGFMEGREVSERKKKRILGANHEDTPSVELAEEDSRRGSD